MISIEQSYINQLLPKEEKEININFDLSNQQLQTFSGSLTIEGKINEISYKTQIPVKINYLANITTNFTLCSNLNGKICNVNEKCDGKIINTIEGACCIGKCIKNENRFRVIGIIFLICGILLLALAVIVLLKKPKTKEKRIEEAIKRIQEKQEKSKKTYFPIF